MRIKIIIFGIIIVFTCSCEPQKYFKADRVCTLSNENIDTILLAKYLTYNSINGVNEYLSYLQPTYIKDSSRFIEIYRKLLLSLIINLKSIDTLIHEGSYIAWVLSVWQLKRNDGWKSMLHCYDTLNNVIVLVEENNKVVDAIVVGKYEAEWGLSGTTKIISSSFRNRKLRILNLNTIWCDICKDEITKTKKKWIFQKNKKIKKINNNSS